VDHGKKAIEQAAMKKTQEEYTVKENLQKMMYTVLLSVGLS
jgi:hypothetical protein